MAHVSLIHFNGTDASTTYIEEVGSHTWSNLAGTELDTAQQKFGTASVLCDGVDNSAVRSTDIGNLLPASDGWLIDFWLRWAAVPGSGVDTLMQYLPSASNTAGITLEFAAGTQQLRISLSSDGSTNNIASNVLGTKTSWASGQWYHIAIIRDDVAGKYFVHVDGVKDIEVTSASQITSTLARCFLLGSAGGGFVLNGWMDEFHIEDDPVWTGGTTFSPPTQEYSTGSTTGTASVTVPLKILTATGENAAPVDGTAILSLSQRALRANQFRKFRFTNPSLLSTDGSLALPFTRATIGTLTDFEGIVRTALSGEARFEGLRRVQNLVPTKSEDCTVDIAAETNTTATATTISMNVADGSFRYKGTSVSIPPGGVVRARIRLTAGTKTGVLVRFSGSADGAGGASANVVMTGTPTVFTLLATNGSASSQTFLLGFENRASFGATDTGTGDFTVEHWQIEHISGQANQQPSEYVSVGVLSSPFHGFGVDGVKYFATENGNTITNNVVTEATGATLTGYKFASLPGTLTNYFSTPDSPEILITGDIDIRVKVAADDWTPVAEQILVAKWNSSNQSYVLQLNADGKLRVFLSTTGSDTIIKASTAATGFADRSVHWVRVTVDVNNGAGGYDVKFYTSEDGIVWVQLGATITTATPITIFDGTAVLEIGTRNIGTSSPLAGKVYYAEVRRGIDGPVVVKFDPKSWQTGSTWVANDTGETWTINGNAKVLSFEKGLRIEEARTNLLVRSEEFDDAAWTKNAATITANDITAPDGNLTADRITEDTTNNEHNTNQGVSVTSSVSYAMSGYYKKGDARYMVLSFQGAGAEYAQVRVDLDLRIATEIFDPTGAMDPASIRFQELPGGWCRVSATVIPATTTTATIKFGLMNSDGTTASYIGTSRHGFIWGAQIEQAAFATSYIPTTSATVTRNADDVTTTDLSFFNATEGTIVAGAIKDSVIAADFDGVYSFDDTTNNERIDLAADTGWSPAVIDGGAVQANLSGGPIAFGQSFKSAQSYKINNFAHSMNGLGPDTDVLGSLPTVTQLRLGNDSFNRRLNGLLQSVDYYNTAFYGDELRALSGNDGTTAISIPMKSTGETGTSSLLLPMKTLVALLPFTGIADLDLPMRTFAGTLLPGSAMRADLDIPLAQLSALSLTGEVGILTATLPLLDFAGYANPGSSLAIPVLTLNGFGLVGGAMSADLRLPKFSLFSNVDGSIIFLGDSAMPLLQLNALGVHGTTGTASLSYPILFVTANGFVGVVGTLEQILPFLNLDASGHPAYTYTSRSDMPLLQISAAGYQQIEEIFRTWVINLRKGAMTEYTNFDFNSYAYMNGKLIAAGPGGLRVIDMQDLDGAAQIDALLRTGNPAYGSSFAKRIPRIYVNYAANAPMEFRTIATHDGPRSYLLPSNGLEATQMRRIPIGRGPKSVNWQFEIANRNGGDFRLNSMILYPDVLPRRVPF